MQKIVYKYRSNNGRKINVYLCLTCFYRGEERELTKAEIDPQKLITFL